MTRLAHDQRGTRRRRRWRVRGAFPQHLGRNRRCAERWLRGAGCWSGQWRDMLRLERASSSALTALQDLHKWLGGTPMSPVRRFKLCRWVYPISTAKPRIVTRTVTHLLCIQSCGQVWLVVYCNGQTDQFTQAELQESVLRYLAGRAPRLL